MDTLKKVSTNDSKEKNKKYEELWSKIRHLIRSIAKMQMIMIKNISKSNLIWMANYIQIKRKKFLA